MCECKCNCDCEIDTSRPEEYELKHSDGRWYAISHMYKKGKYIGGHPFVVVYLDLDGLEFSLTAPPDKIRRKPQWEPEVGKWYFFGDHKDSINSNAGRLRKLAGKQVDGKYYDRSGTLWKYCWPAGDLIELGE